MADEHLGVQESVNAARGWIRAAVTTQAGEVRLEGEAEDAFMYLEAANGWLREGNVTEAKRELADARDRVRTYISRPVPADQRAQFLHALETIESALQQLHAS